MTDTLKSLLRDSSALEEQLVNTAGELTEELEKSLMQIEIKLPDKVHKYMGLCDRLEIESTNLYDKAKRWELAAQSLSNLRERLLSHVKNEMIQNNMKELRGINENFVLTAGKKQVEITDLAKLPSSFVVTTVSNRPDKEKIHEAYKKGEIVPGAEMRDTYRLTRKVNK